MNHLLTAPELLDELEPLLEPPAAVGTMHAERGELTIGVPHRGAEDDAPTREHVERGDILGDLYGVEHREQHDAEREPHTRDDGGDMRQIRDGLVVPQLLAEEVLPVDERVEPELRRRRGQLEVLGQLLRRRGRRVVDGVEKQGEAHSVDLPRRDSGVPGELRLRGGPGGEVAPLPGGGAAWTPGPPGPSRSRSRRRAVCRDGCRRGQRAVHDVGDVILELRLDRVSLRWSASRRHGRTECFLTRRAAPTRARPRSLP